MRDGGSNQRDARRALVTRAWDARQYSGVGAAGATVNRCGAQVVAIGLLLAGLVVACAGAETAGDIALVPFAETTVPLSEDSAIRLVDEGTVCTTESYEFRVHCTDASGSQVSSFGRQGEGPGEFRTGGTLVRGPDETIGVVDMDRMSVFGRAGTLLSEVRLPPGFVNGSATFSSTLTGGWMDFIQGGMSFRHAELDVASGEAVWDRVYPRRYETDAECEELGDWRGLIGGRFSPARGVVFSLCRGQLLFFANRDTPTGTLVRAPAYVPELPNEEEVRAYLEEAGPFAMEDWYRRQPKGYLRGGQLAFDDGSRLWALTDRDPGDGFSYLDVYEDSAFRGTIRVRHHARGIDLLGSTLVVLVDRPVGPRDADGFPDRGVDWYDIGELGFGVDGL